MNQTKRIENPGKIYLASSWRNPLYDAVYHVLKDGAGFDVFNFKGHTDFSWKDVPTTTYIDKLQHPIAQTNFMLDFNALQECDTCVLVLPCNRSAHLELGYGIGKGKNTAVLLDTQPELELMYNMVDYLAFNIDQLLWWLGVEN